jgi:hypothetical protein
MQHDKENGWTGGETAAGAGQHYYSPRMRRELRREPRSACWIRPHRTRTPSHSLAAAPASAPPEPAQPAPPQALREWHDMTPGEQYTEWAELRAFVTWLTDRYELTTEDRMPLCWPRHPGLVEELRTLRQWRLEIYCGQAPNGQAAGYWHTQLRQVLQAATAVYANGCRAGHRGAPRTVYHDRELQAEWAQANSADGIPPTCTAAGFAKRNGGWASTQQIAVAYDTGEVNDLPGLSDYITWAGSWWTPVPDGWSELPGPPAIPRAGTDPWDDDTDPWPGDSGQEAGDDTPEKEDDPWTH